MENLKENIEKIEELKKEKYNLNETINLLVKN